MKKAMRYANDFDLVVIDHCEEPSMKNGVMNEGVVSMELGVVGIPDIAEDMQVARDIFLAEYLDLPVHIAHVSTKGAVDLIREAKKRGVKVTGETCPQYFTLTEEACRGYNTLARCNPPLRTEEDRIAIIEGMRDGTLDLLVSDHAPHHNDDKDIEFSLAANGMTGLETLFGLAYTKLVKPGLVPFTRLVEALTKAPSDLLKLGRGEIKTGLPADLSIFDLDSTFTVEDVYKRQLFMFLPNTIANNVALAQFFTPLSLLVLIAGVVGSWPLFDKFKYPVALRYVWYAGLWLICLLTMSAATYNPFIYFRF